MADKKSSKIRKKMQKKLIKKTGVKGEKRKLGKTNKEQMKI